MSGELNQHITAPIDMCLSHFYFLLCSYWYIGCQSTHYAIIDLNGDGHPIHSISMATHAVRSRGKEKMYYSSGYYVERDHLAGQ
jgi:hypothetical protein